MKKLFLLISVQMLTIAAMAQTLTITEGTTTYQYPASKVGDMTFENGGNTLNILGTTFNLSDVSMTVKGENPASECIAITVDGEGGSVQLGMPSNVAYQERIPEEAQRWLSAKSNGKHITLNVTTNIGTERTATITLTPVYSADAPTYEFTITQGQCEAWASGTVPPDNEIWYTTTSNTILNFEETHYYLYNSKPFDSNIISHTYEKGKGIIRCDGPITTINDFVFGYTLGKKINHISLPNSIRILEVGALRNINVEELRIPDNLQAVGPYSLNSLHIKRFTGKHTTEDGRCVIFEDGYMPYYGNTLIPVKNYMAAFAPAGISEYTVPSGVETLGCYVFAWSELKKINFNEGLKSIMDDCFVDVALDCEIHLPSTLEKLEPYAFRACTGIKGFYGNEKFHTPDHLCLLFEQTTYFNEPEKNGTWICKFVGENTTDYTIPDGIIGLEHYAFEQMPNLKSVTFPSSIKDIAYYAFYQCENLEALYGECVSADHKGIVFGTQFYRLVVTKGVTSYTIPDGITSLGRSCFENSPNLEEIIVPDYVTELGGYDFMGCHELKKVVLSSNLKKAGRNPFYDTGSIEEIYFRSFMPPVFSDTEYFDESDCSHLTVFVPEETLEVYKNSGWSQYAPYMVGYKYDDIGERDPNIYISSDYTDDGKAVTLQQATIGNGIDLVLMGDAFSDRQIADGTYADVMQKAADAFFLEEPYKSYKDYFNVHYVNVVSATEGYEYGGQVLGTGFGEGTHVYGSDARVVEYAKNAISEDRLDDAVIIVMMNEEAYAGTCFMYIPPSGNYGRGLSIAYFPATSDTEILNGLVSHEASGHGFAKLADEYAYQKMGTIPDEVIADGRAVAAYGWWKNVDFTDDPEEVKWSQFLSDERYAGEGLGCYEGGLTYWKGVWRPTESSIMRYNTGGFNAPSRYAIWYRIGKLAYGESWEGSYEDFVAYDQVNRTPAAIAHRKEQAARQQTAKPLPELHAPVVVNHSWREELKRSQKASLAR